MWIRLWDPPPTLSCCIRCTSSSSTIATSTTTTTTTTSTSTTTTSTTTTTTTTATHPNPNSSYHHHHASLSYYALYRTSTHSNPCHLEVYPSPSSTLSHKSPNLQSTT